MTTSSTDKNQNKEIKDLQNQVKSILIKDPEQRAADEEAFLRANFDKIMYGDQTTPQPGPDPTPKPIPTPVGSTVDKFGVVTLFQSTGRILYDYFNNNRSDGKRLDFTAPHDMTNASLTGYFAIPNVPKDEESGKFSIDKHSDGVHVKCLDMGIDNITGATRYRYEDPHPDYTGTLGTGQKGTPFTNKFVGRRFSRYVMPNGDLILSIHEDRGDNEGATPANEWVQLAKWVVPSQYKVLDYPKFVYGTIRIDGANVVKDLRAKWVSMSEIIPS